MRRRAQCTCICKKGQNIIICISSFFLPHSPLLLFLLLPLSLSLFLFQRIEDPLGLPLAEKQKWERRQILLFSVIEQLKWRESTAVIATLAAAKSKHIKKWRQVDTQLVNITISLVSYVL